MKVYLKPLGIGELRGEQILGGVRLAVCLELLEKVSDECITVKRGTGFGWSSGTLQFFQLAAPIAPSGTGSPGSWGLSGGDRVCQAFGKARN